MSINDYRFRNEGALLVLQVLDCGADFSFGKRHGTWRDAKTQDLLDVAELIRPTPKPDPRIFDAAIPSFGRQE